MVDDCNCCGERQRFLDSFESHKPYVEILDMPHIKLRLFPASTEPHLLKWHEDETDRMIISDDETDWMLQFDNELPKPISHTDMTYIPKGRIHRLIKGTGDLVLSIALSDDSQD